MNTVDPRSQAEWDLAMLEFRKAIGQERPEDVNLLASAAYRASQGLPPASFHAGGLLPHIGPMIQPPPVASSHTWHQHWAYVTPAAARAFMGVMQQITWTEPSRWDRLKGTVFVRLRDFRRWLGSKIAGCECDTTW